MKKLFIISVILLGLASCDNPAEAIATFDRQKRAIGLQDPEKQSELLAQEPLVFRESMKNLHKQYANLLPIIKDLPPKFVRKYKKECSYDLVSLSSAYLLQHLKYAKEDAPIINELEDLCATVDLDNATDFNDYSEYQTLVHNIFKLRIYSYKVEYEFDDPWGKILADFKTIKSENIKQALAPLLIEGVSPTSAATTNKELIALIPQIIKNTELLQELNQRINLVNKLKSGQPFPPFEGVVDINDKPISFEQLNLKGKMLFIDIWATYCPDCRKELPTLETLQQTYKGKPITFISISVDRDKEAWKTMVKEKKLNGIHLYASPETKELFKKLYDLRSIPRYMLVDKEGNIISINAPMPSKGIALESLINL